MGLFNRNKIDASTTFFIEKTKGSQVSGRAIALQNLKSVALSGLPEGLGSSYLKDDGTGFIWKMTSMQGIPIEDEIEIGMPKSWGKVSNYPIFDWATSRFSESSPDFEVIAMDNGFWTIAFTHLNSFSEYSSVRVWFDEHYPDLEID